MRPQTKSELLERIEQARTRLEQVIGRLSENQLTTSNSPGGWTIKDHLAHLAAWEVSVVALLQRQSRWEAMDLDEATVEANKGEDALNDLIYRRHKDRSLFEVLTYFHKTHQQMLAALAGLNDEELFKPCAYYQPDEPGDRSILDWIIGNTYEHYEEHQAWIEPLLGLGE